ncbi:hypothetical protein K504DRAFT_188000 [Pleomassaria siparia CBS 279.74]|uniref:Uncharacterized protein n=1 Tax=Pleomassaria siparia CBS 279.74 TaxID=1314801 RepID=A0A6G1JQI5_9PLEO|nr:hypothetical protein K504DRAFT_188000 [Pleomassaria siparia CBS 279.74]
MLLLHAPQSLVLSLSLPRCEDSGLGQVKYCTERKRPCIRGNAFRFRPVTAVKFNAGEHVGSAEQSLEFRGSETWVDIPTSIRFIAPNTEGDDEALEMSEGSGLNLQDTIDDNAFDGPHAALFSNSDRTSLADSHHPRDSELHSLHTKDLHSSELIVDSSSHIAQHLPPLHRMLENEPSPHASSPYPSSKHRLTSSSSFLSDPFQ